MGLIFKFKNQAFKNNLILTVVIYLSALCVNAQDTTRHWKVLTKIGLTGSISNVSSNWKSGGNNSISANGSLNSKLNFKNRLLTWDSELDLQYGLIKQNGIEARKSLDRIFLDSKLGYKIGKQWNIFFSTNFLTQFDAGFRYSKNSTGIESGSLISKFFAPAFITSALGIEFKKSDNLWLRLGTGALRQTFMLDTSIYRNEPKNYGVPIGYKLLNEFALQLSCFYKFSPLKNIDVQARYIGLYPIDKGIAYMSQRMELSVVAKFSKLLNFTFNTIQVYDLNQDSEWQGNQILGLGLLFSF
jgi:hypothetical protein